MNNLYLYSYISMAFFAVLIVVLYCYEKKRTPIKGFLKNCCVFSYALVATFGLSLSMIFIAVLHIGYKI